MTLQLGSPQHKDLFCRSFIDSYLDYEPKDLPWPELDAISLDRLKGIPFWREALLTEQEAGVMVTAFAQTIDDPLIQEAIALQAFEESRHARLIDVLIDRYQIEISRPPYPTVPDDILTAFIDFGFAECLDSFFAFGMFGIARQANYLPESVFAIFEPILDEEARHIVFFVNWVTYLQLQKGRPNLLRGGHALWHYGRAIKKLMDAFGNTGDDKDGVPFTATEATHFMDDLTPELFFSVCLAENARRMQKFDPQLLQPMLFPRLSQVALSCLRLLPKRQPQPLAQKS
jgi:hypothetical protein